SELAVRRPFPAISNGSMVVLTEGYAHEPQVVTLPTSRIACAGPPCQKTLTTTEICCLAALIPAAFGGRNLNPGVIKRAEFYGRHRTGMNAGGPNPGAQADGRAEALLASYERAGYRRTAPAILQPAEPFLDLSGEDIRKRMFLTAT